MFVAKLSKKQLIILIPLILGGVIGLLNRNGFESFETIEKPSFAPGTVIFPIAWSILYLLMGLSSYIVFISSDEKKRGALTAFYIQLAANLVWPILFFALNEYFFSFLCLVLLIIFEVITILLFYPINKTAAYLLLPYLLWSTFAAVLNYQIYVLNK